MAKLGMGPFGNPDGSRATIEQVLEGFVNFGSETVWSGLATRANDRTARVIVGRKGSGKTVYLRRLQADASLEESLYADAIQQGIPSTECIIRFCQLFPSNVLVGKWVELWRLAILRSVVSHLLHSPRLKYMVPVTTTNDLKSGFNNILRSEFRTPVSAYSQVTQIIETNDTAKKVKSYFNDPLWDQLEWTIAEGIKNCPPLCFYIDAIDEEFEHAPMYWLKCQLGLFYQTMRMLRDSKLGGRLHVFICIRDLVLSSVLQSEHRTRYVDEPHVRILNWNRDAIRHLLIKKVEMLDDEFFINDTKRGKTLRNWLGRETLNNTARKIEEPVDQYLLRHTRLLPRDIIVLGNSLCAEISKAKRAGTEVSIEALIRRAVAETARLFGNEQLTICGNQITSNSMPSEAGRYGFSEVYTGDKEYIRGATDNLKTLIAAIGKDRFSGEELHSSRKLADELFGNESDPYSVLWQNGLLGYTEGRGKQKRAIFFSEEQMDDFQLPLNKQQYVFHSCLIDSVNLKGVGKTPII
ncbi:MAG TPA: hypothetical protein VKA60_14080 [Blastocatellia bacterium]|nr:hypothetical protein [Blastocatellia bacterium]